MTVRVLTAHHTQYTKDRSM